MKLFGTPDRTRVLIGLAAAQSANIRRLASIAGISPRAVLEVVRHFESQGVLRSHHVEIERIVEFDPHFRFQELLLALLWRVCDAFPTLVQAARYQTQLCKAGCSPLSRICFIKEGWRRFCSANALGRRRADGDNPYQSEPGAGAIPTSAGCRNRNRPGYWSRPELRQIA